VKPKDDAKEAALDALVKLVAQAAFEDAKKKAPPDVIPTRPIRERLNIGKNKTKPRRDQEEKTRTANIKAVVGKFSTCTERPSLLSP